MKIITKYVLKFILLTSFSLENANAYSSEKENAYCFSPLENKYILLKNKKINLLPTLREEKINIDGNNLFRYLETLSKSKVK
ncbi:hypothetical protein [Fluviispira sanaruensis]|uniref:Uncharacterized protein n=1 Tax=Fluviispira sanaruensis TaxID=2493639 RepID=A0A4P2VHW3_FLUSA|nr:hypothetical protein [Fluviispira sanaruensis]BBH51938.1 hypothetical protein JCM31447_03670 [Fluviispira sanaruensis]